MFDHFKKHYGFHDIKLSGESASMEHKVAKPFPAQLVKPIQKKGYLPEQVINADETGPLFEKDANVNFYLEARRDSIGIQGHKDRASLLLCGNAKGDYGEGYDAVATPTYHSLNQCALNVYILLRFDEPHASKAMASNI